MATGMLTESQLKEKLATPRSPPPIPQEPFTLTKPFIDTPFPYPDCARPLTKKTPNGFGVSTSQISTSHLGIRDKPVNPHTKAFDAAAAKQHATEIHYPSLRSCHLQANYPSTIVKLDPSYPKTQCPDPFLQKQKPPFSPESFERTRPAEAASRNDAYAASYNARGRNASKQHECHISWETRPVFHEAPKPSPAPWAGPLAPTRPEPKQRPAPYAYDDGY